MLDTAWLQECKDAATNSVKSLRPHLLKSYGNVTNNFKPDKSVVTELDGWAESEIKKSLSAFDSSVGFWGEEQGEEGNTRTRWLIDPIDGTEQFIRGIPFCGSMLTLVDGKELLIAIIYNFVTDDLYYAIKGRGAWLNEKRLTISKRPLERSFVEISVDIGKQNEFELLSKLKSSVKGINRFYCSCFTSSLVAQGSIEGRIVSSGVGGPWDYAPGVLLALESGGAAAHSDGSVYDYTKTDSVFYGTYDVVNFAIDNMKKL